MGCLPATDVLDGLIKYSSHCRHLNIETAKPPGIIQIPALIQFSKLETLYVTIHKGGQAALLVTPSSFPKLLGVRWEDWTDYKTRVIQPLPELPWESLRRLTLAYGGSDKLELREILNCLSQCNSLEYAEIRMNRCSATPRLPVLLPKLVTLVLDLHVGRLEIVNFLIAPNLRELTLCRGVLNIQDLTSFVDRSMFTLHTLTMRRIFFSNDSTTSLSECLLLLGNSLESLCIVHSDPILSITHLGSLTRTPGTQYLCPQLRELQLIGCVAPKLGALATMIRSRLSAIMQSSDFEPNLSSLRIAEFELDLPVLETFRRFGLNIIVTEVKNPLAVDL
ncbi:hypothetical protein DXG01_004175 [Tephrocybe rancida]|nr:hypothetical protein DXG01_004175 [Tephrocybe rancida]